MKLFKKKSPRRARLKKDIAAERVAKIGRLLNADILISLTLGLVFIVLCVLIFSFDTIILGQISCRNIISTGIIVALLCICASFYIHHFQRRLLENHIRATALFGLFVLLLTTVKFGSLVTRALPLATGTAVICAIIITIAYDQRFAIGMSIFYCLLACFALNPAADISLFLTMASGAVACCFSIREIRTRMKLLEVGTLAAIVVFITSFTLEFLKPDYNFIQATGKAGWSALATLFVAVIIQGLLPVIEKIFKIATSMTLIDYAEKNNELLKRLAMEAPGTNSHSILVGEIAEAAADAIGCNGLLCRVGAYYHDIGKINKPGYFVENEVGPSSRHKELSPAMSQLIIVGHVKDGIEMAKEYKLPSVLRQFIETHHGTTLIEYFYNEAKKQQTDKKSPPSESEFRYPGPKPKTKEAAIVMLADTIEGAVRSLAEITPTKIEAVVHNMTMKRLQDGQFDECELSLRELHQIEASIAKMLTAHYHGRIAYPKAPDEPQDTDRTREQK